MTTRRFATRSLSISSPRRTRRSCSSTYQPAQLAAVHSMGHALLMKNAFPTVKTIKTFGVPVVHSTVNIASGQVPTLATRWTLAQIRALFGGHVPAPSATRWEEA
jgi:hypothetical protein